MAITRSGRDSTAAKPASSPLQDRTNVSSAPDAAADGPVKPVLERKSEQITIDKVPVGKHIRFDEEGHATVAEAAADPEEAKEEEEQTELAATVTGIHLRFDDDGNVVSEERRTILALDPRKMEEEDEEEEEDDDDDDDGSCEERSPAPAECAVRPTHIRFDDEEKHIRFRDSECDRVLAAFSDLNVKD